MKCKLTPIIFYAVEVDGVDLGKFKVSEQWKGFASLNSTKGELIVKVDPIDFFAAMFEPGKERTCEVIEITPALKERVETK